MQLNYSPVQTNKFPSTMSRITAFAWITFAYLLALAAGLLAGQYFHHEEFHPLWVICAADIVATLVIFGFSYFFKNSSFYDPYWSVIPIFIAAYLGWLGLQNGANPVRLYVVFGLVCFWAIRLTANWARGWRGLDHEDWRYIQLAEQTGKWYWLVSFSGIHFFPTLIVFAGCLPLFPAMAMPNAAFGAADLIGILITLTGIGFELLADNQRYNWAKDPDNKGKIYTGGLWAWSQHPNYFGEVTFWVGLFVLGLAASTSHWWTGLGCVAMWAMFIYITLPMMEKRQLANKPGYAEATKAISRFWPRPPEK